MEVDNIFLKISGSDTIYPYDIGEYIASNPITFDNLYSFKDETTESLISSSIFCVVEPNTPPSASEYQSITEITPVRSGSVYVQTYSIQDLSQVEIQEVDNARWGMVRKKRDDLLLESDWVVLPHSPITGSNLNEWIQYRQDLRDVTNQSNPFEITWPTKPE